MNGNNYPKEMYQVILQDKMISYRAQHEERVFNNFRNLLGNEIKQLKMVPEILTGFTNYFTTEYGQ